MEWTRTRKVRERKMIFTKSCFKNAKMKYKFFTLLFLMCPFYLPENIRKLLVFWRFQGDQKATLGRKGLIQVWTWPGKKWSILKTKCHCLCLAKTFFAALSANSKDLISSFTTFKKSLDVIPVLQIKIFQLTGNYKVRFEAS